MQGLGGADEDRRGGFERGGWAIPLLDAETGDYLSEVYGGASGDLATAIAELKADHVRRPGASPSRVIDPPGVRSTQHPRWIRRMCSEAAGVWQALRREYGLETIAVWILVGEEPHAGPAEPRREFRLVGSVTPQRAPAICF